MKKNNTEDNEKKSIGMLTTSQEDKEFLYKRLIANDVEGIRKMDIKHLNLNIFEPVESMQFIDEEISPLIYCAFYGKADLAKLLLQNKLIDCDLETRSNKHTPLIVACMGSNYEMIKLLVDHSTQINKPNLFYHTPLVVILFRLIEQYQSFQQNRICIRIAELLLLHGADPNWVFQKQKGYNLLHFLCSSNIKMKKAQKQLNYELIKFLISRGANINQKTLNDKKPIDLLSGHCNGPAIRQLLLSIEEQNNAISLSKKAQDDSKFTLKKNKTMMQFKAEKPLIKSKAEQNNYSRDQQIKWYKQNLLSIHGIK